MLKMNQKEPEEEKMSVLQTLLDETMQQYNDLRLDNRYRSYYIMYRRLVLIALTIFRLFLISLKSVFLI